LVVSWQSGIEINRVLSMKLPTGPPPQKVDLFGRKRHRRPYWTYIGADSVEHLKLVSGKGFTGYSVVLQALHQAARRLANQGLLKNSDISSWHPHMLRHSFSTECSHAGVKPEVREFLMGHITGIAWVYQHPDLHESDVLTEWKKVQPYVSLDYTEAALRDEYGDRERAMLSEYLQLRKDFEALKAEFRASRSGNLSQRLGA